MSTPVLDPYRLLLLAVLDQAREHARGRGIIVSGDVAVYRRAAQIRDKARADARAWLLSDTARHVCDLAGVDAERLARQVEVME